MTRNNYSTDEFGRANGRDYHYLVDLDDQRAMRKLRVAKLLGRRVEIDTSPKAANDKLGFVSVQTRDSKGHIRGITEYQYSKKWEKLDSFSLPFEGLTEVKPSNSGGSVLKGPFAYYEAGQSKVTLQCKVHVEATVGELKAMEYGDEIHKEVSRAVDYAMRERMDEYREEKANYQRNECEHDLIIAEEEGPTFSMTGDIRAEEDETIVVCECGAEWAEDSEGNVTDDPQGVTA